MSSRRPLGSPRRDGATLPVLPPPRLVAANSTSGISSAPHCQPRDRGRPSLSATEGERAVLKPPVPANQGRARTASPLRSREARDLSSAIATLRSAVLPSQLRRVQARTPSPTLSKSCSRPPLASVCSIPTLAPDVLQFSARSACSTQTCPPQDLALHRRVGSAHAPVVPPQDLASHRRVGSAHAPAIRCAEASMHLPPSMRSRSSGPVQSFAISRTSSLSACEISRVAFSPQALDARVKTLRPQMGEVTKLPWSEKYYSVPRTSTASTESFPSPEVASSDEEAQDGEDTGNSLEAEQSSLPDSPQTALTWGRQLDLHDPRVQAMVQATTPKPHQAAGQKEPNWDDVLQYCRGAGGSTLRMIGVPQGGVRSLGFM